MGIKAPILNESPMFAASNTCGGDLIKTVGANSFWFYSEELFYFILFLDLDLFKFEWKLWILFLSLILFGVKTSGERSKKYLAKTRAYRFQRKRKDS